MRGFAILAVCAAGLLACAPISLEAAADQCEERARAAQGPELGLTMGVNNRTGAFGSASVGINSDAIMGRDPLAVYESCVMNLTGDVPIRPARLRTM
ncbi:MAG: hypothetical protein ACJAVT_000164 [Yoonia sp.]|jgi:hypothetical protein